MNITPFDIYIIPSHSEQSFTFSQKLNQSPNKMGKKVCVHMQ